MLVAATACVSASLLVPLFAYLRSDALLHPLLHLRERRRSALRKEIGGEGGPHLRRWNERHIYRYGTEYEEIDR